MKISELIRELEIMLDDCGDLPIRAAYQPQYPLAGTIANVWVEEIETGGEPKTLWLAINDAHNQNESPYAPRAAWGGAY